MDIKLVEFTEPNQVTLEYDEGFLEWFENKIGPLDEDSLSKWFNKELRVYLDTVETL